MILPERKEDPNKKYFAISIAITVALFGYGFLALSSISNADRTKIQLAEYTQINITKFRPAMEEPEVEEPEEETPSQEESPAETEEPEPQTPQKIDLDEMLPGGLNADLTPNNTPSRSEPRGRSTSQTEQSSSLRMDDSELESMGLNTLSGSELSAPTGRGSASSRNSDGGSGSGLSLAESSELSSGTRGLSDDGGGGSILGGPEVREGNEKGVEVGLKNLDDFGENYSDLEPIYNELVEWMKENPAELPVPVKRLMEDGRWDPSYLSSRVPFTIDNRQFDLLLMVKEGSLEVHIVLVENTDATYLIDTGFQKESNSLRVGNVGFQNDDIAEIDSRMREAGQSQTDRFYQLFLSWWETIETEQ